MSKVIKVVVHDGLCCQDYGADVLDNFATGTKEECLEKIKADIIRMLPYENDPFGSELVFINGEFTDGSNEIKNKEELLEYLEDYLDPDYMNHVIRIHENDVYGSVYEITYHIEEAA